jgi:glycyl-tRNA synthetase alpha subunit
MSNFLKRTKRASEEIDYDKIHGINPEKEKQSEFMFQRKTIETLQRRLDDTEKERQVLINHIITISGLKEQAQSTQDLFPVLQEIDKAAEYLKQKL